MKNQIFFVTCAAMLYSLSHSSFSANPNSSEVQALNSQIQTQLSTDQLTTKSTLTSEFIVSPAK